MGKIVIAGGTGFVGSYCADRFRADGYDVVIISRQPGHVNWSDETGIISALEGAELLLNLAGKSVDCRYHEKNKAAIFASRLDTTRALGEAIQKCEKPPPLWINSSTATIYRHAEDRPMTEATGEIGKGFSVNVATAWEKSFFESDLAATRRVALRVAIVLGSTGGAFGPYKALARFGLGGPHAGGRQMFSWIHIEDLYRIIRYVMDHDELEGVYNASAPNPVTNAEFMKILRTKLGMPVGLPAPRWMLEMGAFLIRTETELLLKSRWVIPEKLLQSGFSFSYPTLDVAVDDILGMKQA